MGRSDFFSDGRWNFFCDFCGAKAKSSDGQLTWNGYYVCRHHKEVRNPQDFIRGIKDDQTVPWSRPESPDTFVPSNRGILLQDTVPFDETLAKVFFKLIPRGGTFGGMNGAAINARALNPLNNKSPEQTAEQIVFTESLTFGINKVINPQILSGAIDSFAVNTLAVNDSTPLSDPQESIVFSETVTRANGRYFNEAMPIAEAVALGNKKALAEALPLAETITTTKFSQHSLNTARLNLFTLG